MAATLVALTSLLSPLVDAVEFDLGTGGNLAINGYATLAATYADTDHQADFRPAQFQNFGSGLTRTWDFANDSNVALQGIWRTPWPTLRLVGQVVAVNDTYDHFTPRVDWAYFGWSPHVEVEGRIGRFPFPSGLQSETRWVGSSRLEVRAPLAIYHALPVSSLDGADLNWRPMRGDWAMRVRALYGSTQADLASRFGDGTANIRDVIGLSLEGSNGPWRAYVGGFHSDIAASYPSTLKLVAALRAASNAYPPAAALVHDWSPDYDGYSQVDLGVEYIKAPWTLRAEALARFSDTRLVGNLRDAYLLAGYSFGTWTPFASFNALYTVGKFDPEPVPPAPPIATAAIRAHNAAIAGVVDSRIATLGLHWAASAPIDVKLQWDRHWLVRNVDGGAFSNRQPGFVGRDKPINVFTIALDYAF
ncbi:hypothetical protein [Niveibacterium umoris]|uniref:Porin n=1 Tax=Niveibacterium umoris TaxID=1193620 RepID=A0A840BML7_9RHOO|nr:hypothetical protein [Niveibacterium umoris]MBB4014230.1 hypothetical protein [Niveibacterium umoris]